MRLPRYTRNDVKACWCGDPYNDTGFRHCEPKILGEAICLFLTYHYNRIETSYTFTDLTGFRNLSGLYWVLQFFKSFLN